MKRQWVDTLLEMKMDECEEILITVSNKIQDIERRLLAHSNNDKYLNVLADEYHEVILTKHNTTNAYNKLLAAYHKRNIQSMMEE